MIRNATGDDCAELARLLKLADVSLWTSTDLEAFLSSGYGVILVAEVASTKKDETAVNENGVVTMLIGGLICRRLADESEILNFVVHTDWRRQGIGTGLLRAVKEYLKICGVKHIYLEVRAGNTGAQTVYRAEGFVACGSRKNYYREPPEDALLMSVGL